MQKKKFKHGDKRLSPLGKVVVLCVLSFLSFVVCTLGSMLFSSSFAQFMLAFNTAFGVVVTIWNIIGFAVDDDMQFFSFEIAMALAIAFIPTAILYSPYAIRNYIWPNMFEEID